jgi:hypothetical protein
MLVKGPKLFFENAGSAVAVFLSAWLRDRNVRPDLD